MDSQKIRGILNELTTTGTHVSRAYLNKVNKKLVAVAKAALEAEEMLDSIGRDYPGRGKLAAALTALGEE